jgi:hypothetical protein
MGEAESWRERAAQWRSMAQAGDDPYLKRQLLELAEDADAVAAELAGEMWPNAESGRYRTA